MFEHDDHPSFIFLLNYKKKNSFVICLSLNCNSNHSFLCSVTFVVTKEECDMQNNGMILMVSALRGL